MKALILAAGFGTRLLPLTNIVPKPLFPLNGVPILHLCIEQLIRAGCSEIFVNTHHLHEQIESFISQTTFSIPVITIHEPDILDTGGAIKNVQKLMGDTPFFVINSDIVSDVDLAKVWEFHISGDWPVTLVLHNYPKFNKITVNQRMFVRNFDGVSKKNSSPASNAQKNQAYKKLAFTGIQVLSPNIFHYMPVDKKFGSIPLYSKIADQGDMVKGYVCPNIFWHDIGTPDSYVELSIRHATAKIIKPIPENPLGTDLCGVDSIKIEPLSGDGSDRRWFRCKIDEQSFIAASHGIQPDTSFDSKPMSEIDSFIKIGKHLYLKNIPVPAIRAFDRFAGVVILDDLGDTHLQTIINNEKTDSQPLWKNSKIKYSHDNNEGYFYGKSYLEAKSLLKSSALTQVHDNNEIDFNGRQNNIIGIYKKLCELLILFSMEGIKNFDSFWTFQTSYYSKTMIIENECRYFMDAFVKNYLGHRQDLFEIFLPSFEYMADMAIENAFEGLMHRDMQSRNIMVKDGDFFFIDFQSARKGPIQYDLASLLIDPYVNLDNNIRNSTLEYCAEKIEQLTGFDSQKFIQGYRFCAVTRNLQMLGAFSHLSKNRGKTFFEQYIPVALSSLKNNLEYIKSTNIRLFYQFIRDI
ncbi:sugar phosphate nucleotidyltransferase [Desulfamplus magnetovallimortis]|nr:sugar phosphate nucleotidyltransferase [Desulfamplus magnetovallimortis]